MNTDRREDELLRMFLGYCYKVLRRARTDYLRKEARIRKKEKNFSDLRRSETNHLPFVLQEACEEVLFEVQGICFVIKDGEIAEALNQLEPTDRTIILLYYFSSWTDARIAQVLDRPRSTIQNRRIRSLSLMKKALEEMGYDHEL